MPLMIYCTAALTSFSDSIRYITFLCLFFTVQTSDAHPMARYRSGFITCATEVTRLLMGLPGLDENIKFSVIKHLASCCSTSPIETTADSVTVPAIEPTNIISQVSSTEIIQPINSTGQSIDGRTIEQKRLMYQRLITQGATPTYKVKEQGHVITSTDHSQPKPTDTHSCLAGKHEHILKPIPQLPSQALFGNGVKLMPATVLVPVPVTFPNAVKQESAAKTEVWRPW